MRSPKPSGARRSAGSTTRYGEQLVVTCRSQQYHDAVRPEDGVEATLRGAAAIQLRPLDADAVRRYLCADASGPAARARWDPVLTLLGTGAPAGQALDTPLMVGLARAIYNPAPVSWPGPCVTRPSYATLRCLTGQRWNLCCLTRSSPLPTVRSPLAAGRRRTRRNGSCSSPATSNRPSSARIWPGGSCRWPSLPYSLGRTHRMGHHHRGD
jgi:hypothetical protein